MLKSHKNEHKRKQELARAVQEIRKLILFNKKVQCPSAHNVQTAVKRVAELCLFSHMHVWFGDAYGEFFEEVAALSMDRVDEFDVHECATVIWSFGKVADFAHQTKQKNSNVRALVPKMMARIIRHLGEDDFGTIAMALHGLANLGFSADRDILHNTMLKVTKNFDSIGKKSVACIIWASAKVGYYDNVGFFPCARDKVTKDFKLFSTDELCMIAWGLAKYDSAGCIPILDAINAVIAKRIEEFTPLGISRFLSGCLIARFHPGDENALSLFCQFSRGSAWFLPGIVSEALPVFAHYGLISQEFRQLITGKYFQPDSPVGAKEIAHMLGAFAVSGSFDVPMMKFGIRLADEELKNHEMSLATTESDFNLQFPSDARCALYKCIMTYEVIDSRKHNQEEVIPRMVRNMCKEAWILQEKRQTSTKVLQEMAAILEEKQWRFKRDAWMKRADLKVDLVIHVGNSSSRVAVCDMNLSNSFMNSKHISGEFSWREKMIRHCGIRSVRIHAKEWDSLEKKIDKSDFIDKLL